MKIDVALLNTLTAQAKINPRLRQAYDLRTLSTGSGQAQSEDNSQRILNAMEPGTIQKGMKVMVSGFGVGLSWGETMLRF